MNTTARSYEEFVGRWSAGVARAFVQRLQVPAQRDWLEVACGTGALTRALLALADPARIDACDLSDDRVEYARAEIKDERVTFRVESATALSSCGAQYDAAVSGLPFPSVPEPHAMLRELRRTLKPGGLLACYVWDFSGGMEILHRFWSAATALDPDADEDDTEERFTVCEPQSLRRAFEACDVCEIDVTPIDVRARFADFEEFWRPFLSGTSPAQRHVQSLDDMRRATLRERLRASLPIATDGTIVLNVRAWSASGRVPT